MVHLLLIVNALLVLCLILVRMSSRDHVADPIAILVWLLLCFSNTQVLGLLSSVFMAGLVAYFGVRFALPKPELADSRA